MRARKTRLKILVLRMLIAICAFFKCNHQEDIAQISLFDHHNIVPKVTALTDWD